MSGGTFSHVSALFTTGYEGRVYNDLKRCSSNVHVYRKGGPEMKAMHYGNNDRIAPIVLEAKIGYVITHSDQPERKRGKLLFQKAHGVEATKCQC